MLPKRHPYVVVWGPLATILPGSGRPTDRPLGSICRRSARYGEARNGGSFETNTEPNGDANDCWNSASNNCWNDQPDSDRFRLGYRPLSSRRYTCRRKRLHGRRHVCRNFPANFAAHFERNAEENTEGPDRLSGSLIEAVLQAVRSDVFSVAAPIGP